MAQIVACALILVCMLITACTPEPKGDWLGRPAGGDTTYEKFLIPATKGDAKSQNLIGFMLFFGEGVPQNWEAARIWFARAAEQGHPTARLSLAIISTLDADDLLLTSKVREFYAPLREISSPVNEDPAHNGYSVDIAPYIEQMKSPRDRGGVPGRARYETFCAGCHGLNGIAAYVHSPSFAIGERMDKSDHELLRSISNGRERMPGWGAMLAPRELADILSYIRSFRERYQRGISAGVRPIPENYFTFGPMHGQGLKAAGQP